MEPKKTLADLVREILAERQRDPGPHPGIETLTAYVSDELELPEAEAVREHLVSCPGCAAEMQDLASFLAPSPEAQRFAAAQASIWPELRSRLAALDPPEDRQPDSRFDLRRRIRELLSGLSPAPALAAGFAVVALVLGVSLITAHRRLGELGAPTLNLPISVLESPAFTRAADRSGEPPAVTAGSVLVLVPRDDPGDTVYRLEIADADNGVLFTADGLQKGENGNFHVLLPASLEAPRTLRLRIFAPGADEPFDEFTLRLTALPVSSSVFRLAPGDGEERRLAAGTVHTYLLDLAAGEYAHVVVDQRGVDAVAIVIDPAGRKLFEIDTPTGSDSDENVVLLADVAGTYRVEIRRLDDRQADGGYVARLATLRRASDSDRLRATAARAFAEAWMLELEYRGTVPATAVDKYLQAAQSWRRLGEAGREGDAFYRLATMHREAGRPQQAAVYYEQARPLFDPVGRAKDRALNLNDLGTVYFDLGKMAEAQSCFEEALCLHRRIGFQRGAAMTLVNLGRLHHQRGQVRGALERLQEALKLGEDLGFQRGQIAVLDHLGAVYTSMGETRLALDHLRKARRLINRDRDPEQWMAILNLEGNALLEGDDLEGALAAFAESLELAPVGSRAAAVALAGQGLVHDRSGELSASRAAYEKALEIFEGRGEKPETAILLNNLGWLEGRDGQVSRALELYDRALELARKLEDPVIEAATLFGIARVEQERRALKRATALLREAISLVEARRSASLRSDLRIAFLASRQAYYRALVDLLMEQHGLDPGADYDLLAFEASETGRARHLLEMLAEDRSRLLAGVDPELLERQTRLGETIQAEEVKRRERAGASPAERAALAGEQRLRLSAYREAEARIRRASPWFATLRQPAPLRFQDIQERLLDDQTLLLEFHLGEPESYAWAVTPKSSRCFVLPPRSVIEEQARRTYQLMAKSHHDTSKTNAAIEAAELSRMVLQPLAGELTAKRLVLVSDGALHYVPFAALPEPRTGGEVSHHDPPLVERHELVYLPSASVLGALRSTGRKPQPTGLLAVVADPVFETDDERLDGRQRVDDPGRGERFERLVHSRREVETILDLAAPRGETFQALDFDANRELVLSGALRRFRLVHFATHGVAHAEHPELSALLLSRVDRQGHSLHGWLTAREIYELDLTADLVVLSGCDTALGREFRGEGILGLTRGFLYAGADAVAMSLWKVSDRATTELMERFYAALLTDRVAPAEALRRAQNAMRGTPAWQAPYFWAGFVLQGDWR